MFDFFRSHRLLLAPMAGVSDEAFRALCREQGADLAFTEMVSAKGLSYANEKTRHLLRLAPGEDQVAVQLFGHEPDTMAAQGAWIEEAMGESLAYLDVNMGCPARKIVSKGDGSALMKDPELAAAIVRAVRAAVEHPVTVKFRRGWAEGDETCVDFARRMEDAGACAVAVHGRYAEQLYRGSADWGAIARVKAAVGVPVIGNGDVRTGACAVAITRRTGCDAVMIARGAEGNPWVFAQAKAALAGEPEPAPPSVEARLAMARRHARLLAEREGKNIVRMRKHAMWYMAGLPGAATARARINACVSVEDFDAVFDELLACAQAHAE
ncbi:tRNA dihydrouridine synthase DusB [Gordonibacter massiliensis (ex Traore et al. 2017)]|uniref:tRNA dihydrouridine synthase DusB n=1 Tax=Gordonibacter massiliensis (ex Traore et al. 2017) TaxID=1841863 RepID=UPI001C8C048A|nr:tRNA dihydrouridine synthase DusB [Gordonibacter massiliensis (ex Traore et al. 2017)]MBX9034747.1 tRNA dihydrouridine synthase DusB [Gordonibacter massiliensis (ex Traore et al. 2017)]